MRVRSCERHGWLAASVMSRAVQPRHGVEQLKSAACCVGCSQAALRTCTGTVEWVIAPYVYDLITANVHLDSISIADAAVRRREADAAPSLLPRGPLP